MTDIFPTIVTEKIRSFVLCSGQSVGIRFAVPTTSTANLNDSIPVFSEFLKYLLLDFFLEDSLSFSIFSFSIALVCFLSAVADGALPQTPPETLSLDSAKGFHPFRNPFLGRFYFSVPRCLQGLPCLCLWTPPKDKSFGIPFVFSVIFLLY